ncbi:ATP-binding protein [Desulfobacula phenolica]|uniref:histidine kinase n=1 Tax=Desulfobacula phenolica TaxID=90732 RepID=A0A1H2IN38_9BACT|nr:ATP-binding protein [Desulfobacula phenolica]SDU45258.1 PAS domain S-box-containing protein [Desulfobacula phenolica]
MGKKNEHIMPGKKKQIVRISIGRKLIIAFLLLSIVPMSTVAYYNLIQSRNELNRLAKSELADLSRHTARFIDQLLVENQRNAANLAGNPTIVQFMSESGQGSLILKEKTYQVLQNFVDNHPDYNAPGLFDANGIVLASLTDILVGKNRSFRDYFQISIKGQPYISDILVGRSTRQPGVFLSHPVKSSQGEILGINIAWLKADTIWKIIDDIHVGKKKLAYLIDQDGVIIAHPNRDLLYHSLGKLSPESVSTISSTLRFGTIQNTKTPLIPESLGMDQLAYKVLSIRESDTFRYYSPIDYKYHIAGYSRLEKQTWAVVVDLPESEFLASLNRIKTVAYISIGLVTIITVMISILLAKTITFPVRRLTETVAKVTPSTLFNPSSIADVTSGNDEIAYLGQVLSEMVLSLQASEENLREKKQFIESIVNLSPDILYIYDIIDKKNVYSNNGIRKILGFSSKEIQEMGNKLIPLLMHPDDFKFYLNHTYPRYFKTADNDSIFHQVRMKHKNGSWHWLDCIEMIYLREPDGSPKQIFGVIHDITAQKQAENEKLKAEQYAANQEKQAIVGQIAGKMAHDFNNILGIIMGNTELSLLYCNDPEITKILELIFDQTIRGKNLTKNLVAFAKDQEPKYEFFNISEKIDLVLKLLKKDLEQIKLIKEYEQGIPDLLADPGMIEHTLINMIQNSIHALSNSGHPEIMIRTYCLADTICIEIEDNGCGIPEEHIKNIYEQSFTLKGKQDKTSSYKKIIKGTGYGMSNVKKYIEQHKGTIRVESEVGLSTKFTISLPIINKELTTEEKKEILISKSYFSKYILLVEDEPGISDVQYKLLSKEPFNNKVDIAPNGQVAIDLFERNTYDFVSLDYILPGEINGLGVYRHIRKKNQNIPILFLSGNIEFLESIKELKQNDAHIDHLSKPCRNIDYINGINKLMAMALV